MVVSHQQRDHVQYQQDAERDGIVRAGEAVDEEGKIQERQPDGEPETDSAEGRRQRSSDASRFVPITAGPELEGRVTVRIGGYPGHGFLEEGGVNGDDATVAIRGFNPRLGLGRRLSSAPAGTPTNPPRFPPFSGPPHPIGGQ